ncbi:hypothetical protein ARMGADRAFT_475386 [Armillaria gallica]|uniref:Uncharacterized protein n=1 Tax=Armillaria gallica TaxID=47427 RepID=A0A2H3D6F8_ARMGA|nr:hypothetical protein ARMGADRAFT_475386 [Armillaria gallica]
MIRRKRDLYGDCYPSWYRKDDQGHCRVPMAVQLHTIRTLSYIKGAPDDGRISGIRSRFQFTCWTRKNIDAGRNSCIAPVNINLILAHLYLFRYILARKFLLNLWDGIKIINLMVNALVANEDAS